MVGEPSMHYYQEAFPNWFSNHLSIHLVSIHGDEFHILYPENAIKSQFQSIIMVFRVFQTESSTLNQKIESQNELATLELRTS